MIADTLLQILVCPESKQKLALASAPEVKTINDKIRARSLVTREGIRVEEEIDGLLIREDRRYGYVIRKDIPVMLINEAVALS